MSAYLWPSVSFGNSDLTKLPIDVCTRGLLMYPVHRWRCYMCDDVKVELNWMERRHPIDVAKWTRTQEKTFRSIALSRLGCFFSPKWRQPRGGFPRFPVFRRASLFCAKEYTFVYKTRRFADCLIDGETVDFKKRLLKRQNTASLFSFAYFPLHAALLYMAMFQ